MGGRNTIVGAFVTAAARDLMFRRYLSKLHPDQLLYTDTDSVIIYGDARNDSHFKLLTSDMLGDLKDEYGELLSEHPNWYIEEFMAFGPKMYQLILRDVNTKEIVRWDKTMKGISVKGNHDLFMHQSLSKYRDPVIDYCCILQYDSRHRYRNLNEVRSMMRVLAHHRKNNGSSSIQQQQQQQPMSISIRFNQNIFKRKLTHVFTNEFVMSVLVVKDARVTQSKRFP